MTPEATVCDQFLGDHRGLEALLDRVIAALVANDTDDAARIWAECCAGLVLHLETEEHHLIPALLRRSEQDARVLALEHRHIRSRLTELSAAIASQQAKPGAIRDFSDELGAHSRNEERLLYRWAETHLDDQERLTAVEALATGLGRTEAQPA